MKRFHLHAKLRVQLLRATAPWLKASRLPVKTLVGAEIIGKCKPLIFGRVQIAHSVSFTSSTPKMYCWSESPACRSVLKRRMSRIPMRRTSAAAKREAPTSLVSPSCATNSCGSHRATPLPAKKPLTNQPEASKSR